MKVRTDFITNSSSAAYIVRYKNPINTAKKMLDIFFKNWKDSSQDESHPCEEEVRKWLKDNPNFDGNIIIPWTCNYETFIYGGDWIDVARGRRVRVDTCNNEDWISNGLEIERYVGEEEYYDYIEYDKEELFLDLTDFKIKTRAKFNKEREELFDIEIEQLEKEREKEEKRKKE